MDHRRQGPPHPRPQRRPAQPHRHSKNSSSLLNERLQQLIGTATDLATSSESCADRLARHRLGPVLWRKSGADLPLRLLVIAPLAYRLRQGSKLLYRQPAYLLCTDPDMSLEEFLQAYLWCWGIEVNFREEKTLIGTGDAQVRTAASNQHLPAVTVAAYALLWVAALLARTASQPLALLRPPKWRKDHRETDRLPSTGDLLRLLRAEIWVQALKPGGFDHFATDPPPDVNAQKPKPELSATLFAAV